jgi:hypothetical protein
MGIEKTSIRGNNGMNQKTPLLEIKGGVFYLIRNNL